MEGVERKKMEETERKSIIGSLGPLAPIILAKVQLVYLSSG